MAIRGDVHHRRPHEHPIDPEDTKAVRGFDKKRKGRKTSNEEWVNPHDPDAKVGVLALHPHEFIRRWLLHVLPKGFTRIRHYGFLSSAAKKTRLRIRFMLGASPEAPPELPEPEPFTCEHCGGSLTFLREIAPSMSA